MYSIIAAVQGKVCDQVASRCPPRTADETLVNSIRVRINGQQAGLSIFTVEREEGTQHPLQRLYDRPLHSCVRIHASLNQLVSELKKICHDIVRLTVRLEQIRSLNSYQQDLFVTSIHTELSAAIASIHSSLGLKSVILASEIEIPCASKS